MRNDMINKIECKGELKLGDFSIPCYVLENAVDKMLDDVKYADEAGCCGCFFAHN